MYCQNGCRIYVVDNIAGEKLSSSLVAISLSINWSGRLSSRRKEDGEKGGGDEEIVIFARYRVQFIMVIEHENLV